MWKRNAAHVHTEDSEIDLASIFYKFPQGVRGPFYIESKRMDYLKLDDFKLIYEIEQHKHLYG